MKGRVCSKCSPPQQLVRWNRPGTLNVRFRLKDLAAAVLARLQIDVMGTAALAALLVFDIYGDCQRIVRTALIALHARGFALRDCHFKRSR